MTQTWIQSFQPYCSLTMIRTLFLGFSSGLPALLVLSTLSYWLSQEGISCDYIGAIAFTTLPYSLKFLFAPFTNHILIPYLTNKFGQRRGWLLLTQVALCLSIIGLGYSDPKHHFWLTAFMCFMVTMWSSLQDIIIDAYRIETIDKNLQPTGGIVVTLGYRLSMLISGAGAIALSDYMAWKSVYIIMALLMSIGILVTLLSPEPRSQNVKRNSSEKHRIFSAFKEPLTDFISRPHWIMILALIFLYQASDHLMSRMTTVFYHEIGFTGSEIAYASKTGGFWIILLGIITTGILTARVRLSSVLIWGSILHGGTNLIMGFLAVKGHSLPWLYGAVISENFTYGVLVASFTGFLSSFCNPSYSMTQYALFSSITAISRILLQSISGIIAPLISWSFFFNLCAIAALPGIFIILYLKNHSEAFTTK